MAEKKSFVMYENWAILLANLPEEQAGLLIKAVCAYQIGKEFTIEDPVVQAMFAMMLPKMQEDADAYAETKSKRASAARAKWGNASNEDANAENADANGCKTMQVHKSAMLNDANAENEMQMHGDTVTDTENDNDTENDTVTEKEKDSERKKTSKKRAAASAYVDDPELNRAVCDFVEHRKKLRKPMTDKAIELFINRVRELAATVPEQIALIDTAIERGWQTVYPARSEPRSGARENSLDDHLLEIINGGGMCYDSAGGF